MFAGSLGTVLVVLIGISMFSGRHSGEVPVVTADGRPIREKPANPGGMKVDGADNDVFSGGADTGNARLAAAPEAPNAQALRGPFASLAAASALTPPPSAALLAPPPAAVPDSEPAPVIVEPRPAPAFVGRPDVAAVVPPLVRPDVGAVAPSASRPVPAKPPVEAHAATMHPPAAEAHAATAHPAVTEAHTGVTPAHPAMVQLAAVASEDAARSEWAQLSKKMPDLLNGRKPTFQKVERDGHIFWRLRTAGFGDETQARSFCDRIRAKGAGCSVADF
jgi:hypothetical protein